MSPERYKRMSQPKVVQFPSAVKPGFELALFVIQHHHEGYADEFVYLPVCSRCRKPITDLDSANLVSEGPEEDDFRHVGQVNGQPLLRHPGQVNAYHFECDSGAKPWRRLSTVLRCDQGSYGEHQCGL